jgi:hypothetical protein
MKPTAVTNETDAALDLLLQSHLASPDEELTPSSGFTLSVMEAVRRQSAESQPIVFPWRRMIPGVIAIACLLASFVAFGFSRAGNPQGTGDGGWLGAGEVVYSLFAWAGSASGELALGSVLLAGCLSVAVVAASFRLVDRSR